MDGLFACLEEDHENAFALQCIYPLFLTSSFFFLTLFYYSLLHSQYGGIRARIPNFKRLID